MGGAGTGGTRESLGPHQPQAVILRNPFLCRFSGSCPGKQQADTQPSSLLFPDPGPAAREAGVFPDETSPGLASFPHLAGPLPHPASPAFPTFRSPDTGLQAAWDFLSSGEEGRGEGRLYSPSLWEWRRPAMRAMPGIRRFPSIFGSECHCFLKWMGCGRYLRAFIPGEIAQRLLLGLLLQRTRVQFLIPTRGSQPSVTPAPGSRTPLSAALGGAQGLGD